MSRSGMWIFCFGGRDASRGGRGLVVVGREGGGCEGRLRRVGMDSGWRRSGGGGGGGRVGLT